MILLAVLLILTELLLLAAYVAARRSKAAEVRWWLHEVLLAWQTLYWIGACSVMIADPTSSNILFVIISSAAQLSLTIGCFVAVSRRTPIVQAADELSAVERRIALAVGVGSAAVCAAFIGVVLRNEDLRLILASVITGDEDFISYRLVMSTGRAVYLAPGYVKQFRDVLLMAAFLCLALRVRRPPWLVIVTMGLLGFAAAILSGERSVLMIYVYTFGLAILLRPGRGAQTRRMVTGITAAVGLSAFIGSTILLGRTTAGASSYQAVGESLWGLVDRLVLTVPRENAAGFPVWGAHAPTWGYAWWSDLAGILPGVQAGLSNELHALLGGSPLGNATLGLSSDVYLAWGMIGTAIVPFCYALSLSLLDRALLSNRSALIRTFRLSCIPLTFNWYSPFLFILNGGVILVAIALAARTRLWRE